MAFTLREMKQTLISLLILLIGTSALAARTSGRSSSDGSTLTYDLGASAGSYGGQSYSEVGLGLNWYLQDWLNWRNAVFARFGNGETKSGLDTSLRLETSSQGDNFGFKAFAGPGYRFSSQDLSAAFGEAGVVFRLGGLSIGGGIKGMYYPNPGKDSRGDDLSHTDTTYFIILGGGGVL